MGSKSSTADTAEAIALRKRQREQLANLDEETNLKAKRLFSASQGLRLFRGSADTRLMAGDSAQAADTRVRSDAPGLTAKSKRRAGTHRYLAVTPG
jgi:hypothetical protein